MMDNLEGRNLTFEGQTPEHYDDAIASLTRAKAQLESIARGEPQPFCAVCEDNGHTAEACLIHNTLLLAALGDVALLGQLWRCFHCGGVFTDEVSAANHFGETPDTPAACLLQLAELAGGEL